VVNCGNALQEAFGAYYEHGQLVDAATPAEAVALVHRLLPTGVL
jgi:hypothetical protein